MEPVSTRDIDKFCAAQTTSFPFEGLLWDLLQAAKCQLILHWPHFQCHCEIWEHFLKPASLACWSYEVLSNLKKKKQSPGQGSWVKVLLRSPLGSSQCSPSPGQGGCASEKATQPLVIQHSPNPFASLTQRSGTLTSTLGEEG